MGNDGPLLSPLRHQLKDVEIGGVAGEDRLTGEEPVQGLIQGPFLLLPLRYGLRHIPGPLGCLLHTGGIVQPPGRLAGIFLLYEPLLCKEGHPRLNDLSGPVQRLLSPGIEKYLIAIHGIGLGDSGPHSTCAEDGNFLHGTPLPKMVQNLLFILTHGRKKGN